MSEVDFVEEEEGSEVRCPRGMTKPITICPFCEAEMENCYLDINDQPVYVDQEELTISPLWITDIGVFVLEESSECQYADIVNWHHQH